MEDQITSDDNGPNLITEQIVNDGNGNSNGSGSNSVTGRASNGGTGSSSSPTRLPSQPPSYQSSFNPKSANSNHSNNPENPNDLVIPGSINPERSGSITPAGIRSFLDQLPHTPGTPKELNTIPELIEDELAIAITKIGKKDTNSTNQGSIVSSSMVPSSMVPRPSNYQDITENQGQGKYTKVAVSDTGLPTLKKPSTNHDQQRNNFNNANDQPLQPNYSDNHYYIAPMNRTDYPSMNQNTQNTPGIKTNINNQNNQKTPDYDNDSFCCF